MACDLGANMVYMTDLRGNMQHQFGGFGHAQGLFNNPAGITTDAFGNMLIADRRNNKIQIFNSAGNFSGFVELSTPLARPSDIHLTHNGFLICADLTRHCACIYKLLF